MLAIFRTADGGLFEKMIPEPIREYRILLSREPEYFGHEIATDAKFTYRRYELMGVTRPGRYSRDEIAIYNEVV